MAESGSGELTQNPGVGDGVSSEKEGKEEEEDGMLKQGGGGDSSNTEKGGEKSSDRKTGKQSKLPQCCLSAPIQPTFFIGGANGIALVEGPLLALGWKRTLDKYDEGYKLKWVENKSRINYLTFREGEQLVNHIPNCRLLTNKLGLLCSLQEYERVTLLTKGRLPKMKMADFVPETYKLDEKMDREKFLHIYKDGETWICKPISMNQGKGIFLLRTKEKIYELLSEREAKLAPRTVSRVPMLRIVQRYISHPLLLEGRKFDIRSYMFIASTIPFLVLYHKGYVRLSCHKYDHEDTNLTTHLTNQFVQKKDPAYKDNKEDTAWTMDKLNEYINLYVAEEKGLETDWVYGTLTRQMQRITLHCFNSVKHKLQCKMGYFDLYGMDFMVDENMKVWLIEINANPALHINCQALKEAIPPVVEDALYLAIECFEKSCKGQPLMPINSLGGYTVLYCGSSPNMIPHRQIRSVSPFKDITIWNRPSGTAVANKRHSPNHNFPKMQGSQAGNVQATSNIVVTSTRNDKRNLLSSALPIINIGVTLQPKTYSGGGNYANSNKYKQEQPLPSSQSQQQQQQQQPMKQAQQPAKRISVTVGASEDGQKFCRKHSISGVEKSREKLHRGN